MSAPEPSPSATAPSTSDGSADPRASWPIPAATTSQDEKGPDGADELGADDGGDGDGGREPVLRESPPRPQVVVDRQPVRSDHAADDAARARQHRRGRAATSRSNAHRRRTTTTTRMTAESPSAQSTAARHRFAAHPSTVTIACPTASSSSRSRVRNRCREACEHGHRGEEHRVDRAPVSTTCLVLGQHQRAVAKESGVLVARPAAPRGRDRRLRPEHGHFATLATRSARLDSRRGPPVLRRPGGRRRTGAPAVELAKRTSEITAAARPRPLFSPRGQTPAAVTTASVRKPASRPTSRQT